MLVVCLLNLIVKKGEIVFHLFDQMANVISVNQKTQKYYEL